MMCKHNLFVTYMLVRTRLIKMVHKLFAGYSYIMDLINIGKMEHNIIMLSKFEY